MGKSMVAARPAQSADEEKVSRAALNGGFDGDLAIGLILVAGKGQALDRIDGFGYELRRIEIAHPKLRGQPERSGMTHAGIGGDHPPFMDAPDKALGRLDRPGEKNGEVSHGENA